MKRYQRTDISGTQEIFDCSIHVDSTSPQVVEWVLAEVKRFSPKCRVSRGPVDLGGEVHSGGAAKVKGGHSSRYSILAKEAIDACGMEAYF